MTKKFNEFENNNIQGKQIDFPAKIEPSNSGKS